MYRIPDSESMNAYQTANMLSYVSSLLLSKANFANIYCQVSVWTN